MYRNSGSPADADILGVIEYEGRNDNSQDVRYVQILSQANDVTDGTEDGSYYISTMVGGALSNRMNVIPAETVFNEESKDIDFRVESDNLTHALFVQGSDGNVGIGTSSPATFGKLSLTVDGTTTPTTADNVKNSSVNLFAETNGDSANNTVGIFGWQSNAPGIGSGIGFSRENASNWGSQIRFYTHPTTTSNISDITERMRIESTGNLLIGSTSYSASSNNKMIEAAGQVFFARSTTGQAGQLVFQNPNGSVGQVVTSGNSTTYNTSSDYRLKDNINYTFDATSQIKQLKPCEFNFKTDLTTKIIGFIAHETQEIVPQAVSGTKDGMTAEVLYVDGNEIPDGKKVGDVKEASKIDPQGMDNSHLVPLLVKTIQELEARITALESA